MINEADHTPTLNIDLVQMECPKRILLNGLPTEPRTHIAIMNHLILLKRSTILFLSVFGLASSAVAESTAEKRARLSRELSTHYYAAQASYLNGDIAEAKASLKKVFEISPRNSHGIALQSKIQLHGDKMVLKKKERAFSAIMLKVVDMKDVPMTEAIKRLKAAINISTEGKQTFNFAVQDPKKVFGNEKITLKATDIPAGEVLKHIMLSSRAHQNFGKYAIVIRPDVSLLERAKQTTSPNTPSTPAKPTSEIPSGRPLGQ